ncbi:translation initiation factor IF-2 [Chloroherpeton thalassium ATCC 35110]|uniref:Translation initiation factor IF-2 n=1 Tax=Chloroherpeton thalassium (strain ATCC 35110 / GB-78) TaxID=517418 RepID=IF2_CHLT3|nr:translation initiation factor IF-2 [Chloroherpeton thalassium]B3QUN2.1 RecName: Full=Translation initiation factor IF-2 [Chloroherpeton thalassium ATCC 35110]ACF12938.1 translation initiation factor IF-2 [Chloroherpeton thalassium ATCC 35110]
MPAEKEKKKHKLIDIAVELQVSLDDIRSFVEELGYRTTNSTKVTDSVKELILDNYSDEKKKSDLHKKLKAEKNRKIQLLEKRVSPQADKFSKKKTAAKKEASQEKADAHAKLEPSIPEEAPAAIDIDDTPEVAPEIEIPSQNTQEPEPVEMDEVASAATLAVEEAPIAAAPTEEPMHNSEAELPESKIDSAEAVAEEAAPEVEVHLEPKEQEVQELNHAEEAETPTTEASSEETSAVMTKEGDSNDAQPFTQHEPVSRKTQNTTNVSEENKQHEKQPETLKSDKAMDVVQPVPIAEETAEQQLTEASSYEKKETNLQGENLETNEADAAQTEAKDDDAQSDSLQAEISRQQNEISNRFSQSENIAGLKVFGEIELHKKKRKRKKNFREQAKDLKQQMTPEQPKQEEKPVKKEKPKEREKPAAGKKEQTPGKKPVREDQKERVLQDGPARVIKKKPKKAVDEKVVDRNIRQTMMTMDDTNDSSARQKFRKIRKRERLREQEIEAAAKEAESKVLKITEFASTHELADMLGVTPKEVIQKCFKLGKFITINQRLDKETIELLSLEFNYEVHFISDVEATEIDDDPDLPEDMKTRPPVVTIMGHVDHGKTSLLDYIRNSNVVAGESGGITQHMGAYEVTLENKQRLTFLDTPGHEAFTAMRARGAQVTDVVILVVAADDNVMPQTVEAINHAKAAEVPIIVAINKIDKPDANPEKIRTQLADIGVLVEDWGGSVQCQEISAKKGTGVRDLIDKVLVEAELLELKANYSEDKLSRGVVIEAELDKGKGVIATILVQTGIINVGMPFVAGGSSGRIRAMLDERGNRLETVYPSQPVRILGFEELPQAGDLFSIMPSDREAREIAQRRQVIRREHEFRHSSRVKLNDIAKQVQEGQVQELRVIIKADTDGSIQALADGLMKVQTDEVKVEVIHRGVGQITETDVLLAAASDAIIIGFRVRPNVNAKKLAEKEEIDIRFYSVIYHVLEDIHDALEGMLSPELQEKVTATVEIRDIFRISKIGNVAGCHVLDGKINRDSRVRLLRDGIQIYEGVLDSLKRHKDDVKEVDSGYDCGLTLKNYDDIKVNDIVESFETVETKRKLVVS